MNENNTGEPTTAEHLKEIIRLRFKLLKFQLIETTAKVGASVLSSFLIFLVLFFFILFASIALAFVINDITNHSYIGFVIIASVYFLAFALLSAFRKKWLRKGLINYLIHKFFEK